MQNKKACHPSTLARKATRTLRLDFFFELIVFGKNFFLRSQSHIGTMTHFVNAYCSSNTPPYSV